MVEIRTCRRESQILAIPAQYLGTTRLYWILHTTQILLWKFRVCITECSWDHRHRFPQMVPRPYAYLARNHSIPTVKTTGVIATTVLDWDAAGYRKHHATRADGR